MSSENEEKIKKLAESLKSLHLVGSMDDAINRAKEIIVNTEGEEKSVRDLMEGVQQLKNEVKQDAEQHEKEKRNVQELQKEASTVQENVDDANIVLDIAEAGSEQGSEEEHTEKTE